MPKFFYNNSYGNKTEIFPVKFSDTLKGFVLCKTLDNSLISIYIHTIKAEYSEEEIKMIIDNTMKQINFII